MIMNPHPATVSVCFPVDQTTINTSIRLMDVVGGCLPDQLHKLPPDIHPHIRSITAGAKSDRNWHAASKKQDQKYDPRIPSRVISVAGFGVVKLHATRDPVQGWTIHTIDFNPGSLTNGHNGHILTEDQLLRALSVLVAVVTPLLANTTDWIHIVPGLHPQSRAWWKSLEIPFHVIDEDGAVLCGFSNAKHPEINLKPFNARVGESITFANSNDTLKIRVYRKDLQMVKKHHGDVADPAAVLRIEVRLSGDKLMQYLQHGTWHVIDGINHLVSFRPNDLRDTHYAVVTRFDGVFTRVPSADGDTDNKWARVIGWIAFRTGLPIHEPIDYYKDRFLAGNPKKSVANSMSRLRKSARHELALLSPVSLTELFSESAWNQQPNICVPKLEAMTQARHACVEINSLVAAVYGTLTPAAA